MSEQVVHITAAPHSVQLSRNASGGVGFEVKYYGVTIEEALINALAIFARLDGEFPVKEKK